MTHAEQHWDGFKSNEEPGRATTRTRVRWVTVDDLRIRVSVRAGTGTPLLLIMGIGGNLDMWDPFLVALPPDTSVITFDAPGTGESSTSRRRRSMADLAGTVERMLDVLGCDTVDVLGVSFGGALAQQLAHVAPHRVRRLVLVATAPGLGGVPGNPRALLELATPARFHSMEHFRAVAPKLYGGGVRRDPELLTDQAYARLSKPPSLRGYVAQIYAILGWTSLPWLHKLHQPTLVIAGDDDPIVPLANARILAARIPGARLHVVRGAGHLLLLEAAPEAASIVSEFLSGRYASHQP